MKKCFAMAFCTGVMAAALSIAPSMTASATSVSERHLEWEYDENGKAYWYENGVKQGTYDDTQGILGTDPATGEATNRGREIYDPASNAWYWLDSCYNGAKAVSKEVWMPYTYQDELVMAESGTGREMMKNSYSLSNYNELLQQSWFPSTRLSEMVERQMLTRSGKWVRYDENGKMMKGWVTIEGDLAKIYPDQAGNTYYYDTVTGSMVKDGYFIIDGYWNTFNENGVLVASANPKYATSVEQVSPDADYSVVTSDMRPYSAEEKTSEAELEVVQIETDPELSYYENYEALEPGQVAYETRPCGGGSKTNIITKDENGNVVVSYVSDYGTYHLQTINTFTEKTDSCDYCNHGYSQIRDLDDQSYDLLDDNGEVIGRYYKYVCPDCGFTVAMYRF